LSFWVSLAQRKERTPGTVSIRSFHFRLSGANWCSSWEADKVAKAEWVGEWLLLWFMNTYSGKKGHMTELSGCKRLFYLSANLCFYTRKLVIYSARTCARYSYALPRIALIWRPIHDSDRRRSFILVVLSFRNRVQQGLQEFIPSVK
jgi:hypothetical protein